MATLEEMKQAVPTFFNTLDPEAKTNVYKGTLIVTRFKPKSIRIYRFVPSKVRPVIDFVQNAANLDEARQLIDNQKVG